MQWKKKKKDKIKWLATWLKIGTHAICSTPSHHFGMQKLFLKKETKPLILCKVW